MHQSNEGMDNYEKSVSGGPTPEGFGDAAIWPENCAAELKTSLRMLKLKVEYWEDYQGDTINTCAGLLSIIGCPGFQELWA